MKILLIAIVMSFSFSQAFADDDFSIRLNILQNCISNDNLAEANGCVMGIIGSSSSSQEAKELKLIHATCSAQNRQGVICYKQAIQYLRRNPLPWTDEYDLHRAELVRALCETPDKKYTATQKMTAADDRYLCWVSFAQSEDKFSSELQKAGCSKSQFHWIAVARNCELGLQSYIDNLGGKNQVATQHQPQSHP